MISIKEWVISLNIHILAGEAGLNEQVGDLYLLNLLTEWVTDIKPQEVKSKVILVPTTVLPGYSSFFDVLLRFLKAYAAVGVLYLGGKKTDFSKGTLLLSNNLGLPLMWVPDDVTYSFIIRGFYRQLIEHEQQFKAELEKARLRMDKEARELFSLAAWLDFIEQELQVNVVLENNVVRQQRPTWVSYHGKRQFIVPLRIGTNQLSLRVDPVQGSSYYESDGESEWIAQLAGTLQSRTENFLLNEIPGIDSRAHWTLTLESILFGLLSLLPMMDFHQPIYPIKSEGLPQVIGSLSLLRRVHLLDIAQIKKIHVLWLTFSDKSSPNDVSMDLFSLSQVPHVYRIFHISTILMRDQILTLFNHPQFHRQIQLENISCVPWRDWEHREGVVVVWCAPLDDGQPSEAVLKELVDQLESRLRQSLCGTFHRESLQEFHNSQELMQTIMTVFDKTYYQFLSLPEGIRGVQFVQTPEDAATLLLYGVDRAAPLDASLHLLQPILEDKHAEPLLLALEAYLENGGKLQVAAERLYLHRNTLRYRLNRIEQLLQVDLTNPQIRFSYQLALRAWRLRQRSSPHD